MLEIKIPKEIQAMFDCTTSYCGCLDGECTEDYVGPN